MVVGPSGQRAVELVIGLHQAFRDAVAVHLCPCDAQVGGPGRLSSDAVLGVELDLDGPGRRPEERIRDLCGRVVPGRDSPDRVENETHYRFAVLDLVLHVDVDRAGWERVWGGLS